MTSNDGTNGGGNGVTKETINHLTITATAKPWHVHIAGAVENDGMALAMLRQAVDYYEARIRAVHAQQLMAQMRAEEANARIAASLLKR